jgi:hypothetical protein
VARLPLASIHRIIIHYSFVAHSPAREHHAYFPPPVGVVNFTYAKKKILPTTERYNSPLSAAVQTAPVRAAGGGPRRSAGGGRGGWPEVPAGAGDGGRRMEEMVTTADGWSAEGPSVAGDGRRWPRRYGLVIPMCQLHETLGASVYIPG